MVSTDKLIKVGVKYSDSYFETLKNIYNNAYRNNESLEEFLNDTQDYSIGNPLEAGGFKDTLTNLIASSTNDIRFSRPAQKALMNTIIRNTTGELIVDVGNDVKQSVRDIVAKGYNTRTLSRQNVADEISSTLDGINRKRARTIARTEIKRAQTTSNYVVALDRGANAYKYKCGAKPCDICKVDCGKNYPITDLEHLPPRHPNCMCSVSFFKDPNLPEVEKPTTNESTEPTTKPTSTTKRKPPLDVYDDVDTDHKPLKVYKFKNTELAFDADGDTALTLEEATKHLNSLPKVFEDIDLERITFKSYADPERAGYIQAKNMVIFKYTEDKDEIRNTFTHELAHALDRAEDFIPRYSNIEEYEKIVKADNKLYAYKDKLSGRKKTPWKFPTENAEKMWEYYRKDSFIKNSKYIEDFADSTKLYLNANTHDKFVKEFPNRAEYLESIYGKPKFDLLSKPKTQKESISTPYDFDIEDIKEYISELKEEMKNATDKYELLDLQDDLKESQKDLKSFERQREEYIKNQRKPSSSTDYVPGYDDVKLPDFPGNTPNDYKITDKIKKKLDEFGEKYSYTKKENLQFFTKSSSSEVAQGYEGTVYETGAQKQWLKKHAKEPIHATHNHPRPEGEYSTREGFTMFSRADLEQMVSLNKSREINQVSFSAENQWNRITITKNEFFDSADNKLNGINEAIRHANLKREQFYDKYHPVITPGLEHTRSVKRELKSKNITGKEYDKRMEIAEKEAKRLDDALFTERQKNFPKLVEEMNTELNKVGLNMEVKYKKLSW